MTDDLTALLAADPTRAGRALLSAHGLPADPLVSADGWSNQVLLAPHHVVRFGSGRFRDAFAHEAHTLALLPPEVPHAAVVAHGKIGEREWLILERVAGDPLDLAWPRMTYDQRHAAITQLGEILHALHGVALPPGYANPWLEDALGEPGKPRDVYHLPPERTRWLLEALRHDPGIDGRLLDEADAFIRARLDAFAAGHARPPALVHADVHFANLLWDAATDRLSALLDFEGARPAPPDVELDTFLHFCRRPAGFRRGDADRLLLPGDLVGVPEMLAGAYPALFAHPRLTDRLAVYEALWWLVQLQHFPRGGSGPDPAGSLRALLAAGDAWRPF